MTTKVPNSTVKTPLDQAMKPISPSRAQSWRKSGVQLGNSVTFKKKYPASYPHLGSNVRGEGVRLDALLWIVLGVGVLVVWLNSLLSIGAPKPDNPIIRSQPTIGAFKPVVEQSPMFADLLIFTATPAPVTVSATLLDVSAATATFFPLYATPTFFPTLTSSPAPVVGTAVTPNAYGAVCMSIGDYWECRCVPGASCDVMGLRASVATLDAQMRVTPAHP